MRYIDALKGEFDGNVPFFLRDFTLGMDVLGVSTADVFSDGLDPRLSADCICAFQRFTGQDAVIGCTHSPAFIVEQFGGEMRYPEYGIPVPMSRPLSGVVDYDRLDTDFRGRIVGAFESYKIVKERMDGIADVVANITGPLTKASVLAGAEDISMMMNSDPDALDSLLSFCTGFTDSVIERIDSDGSADSFFIAAATDNPDMFGFDMYDRFSVPYLEHTCRKLKGLGYTVVYHPHGVFVSEKEDHSDSIFRMDIDGYHFAEHSYALGLAEVFRGKMCLLGGTDIVPTLMDSPDSTEKETLAYLDAFRDNDYIFMASCSLHRGVPLENIKRMCGLLRPRF